MKSSKYDKQEAKAKLLKWIKPGDTVYTILDHVSASGVSRNIRVMLLSCKKGQIVDLHPNHLVSVLLEYPRASKGDGFRVGGCGMDMGFHVVNSLSYALFREDLQGTNAKATKLRRAVLKVPRVRSYFEQGGGKCPDPTKPGPEWDGCAGYVIQHRWL